MGRRKANIFYMVTTPDDLELPLLIGTIEECSTYTGLNVNTLKTRAYEHYRGRHVGWNHVTDYHIYRIGKLDEV